MNTPDEIKYTQDSIVNSIINKFIQRSNVGITKYGSTLERNDLSKIEWIIHTQEELMDSILYLEKFKKELILSNELNSSK